jgi:sugar (pentulose or hexulose) kinase
LINIGGGGSASSNWTQIIADVVGKKINVSDTPENTALGAAIMAAYGLNIYKDIDSAVNTMCRIRKSFVPDNSKRTIYMKFFNDVYRDLYPAIRKYSKYLGCFHIDV